MTRAVPITQEWFSDTDECQLNQRHLKSIGIKCDNLERDEDKFALYLVDSEGYPMSASVEVGCRALVRKDGVVTAFVK